jgi:hypothetical protein
MTALILGAALLALALVILVMPFGLFILGGGGDTAKFSSFLRGFVITSITVGVAGLVSLMFGLITRK